MSTFFPRQTTVAVCQSIYLFLLQVHVNLGAGESELASPRGLRLDDLKWHEVKITRTQADLSLTIDRKHSSR